MALKIKGQTVIDDDRGLGDISKIGIGTTANPTGAKLLVDVGSGVTAVTVQGSEGQLFSVTNELTTGSIFSVNDISGIPSIDVDADGTILVAPYSTTEKVGIGTTSPAYKMDVVGDINFTGTLFQNGTEYTSGITSLTNDTSPVLGADLDANSNNIFGVNNLNVTGVSTFTSTVEIKPDSDIKALIVDSTSATTDSNPNVTLRGNGPQVIDFRDSGNGVGLKIAYRTSPNQFAVENSENTTTHFKIDRDDGRVELNYGGSKKFETTGAGVSITGDIIVSTGGTIGASSGVVTYYGDGSNLTGVQVTPQGTDTAIQFNANSSFSGIASLASISTSTFSVGIGTIIDIKPYDTQNSGTLSFEASAGQLFSITNNLTTGSIFSVNDVSGIPSIDVDADGTVLVAPYSTTEKVGIGTTNPQYKLHVIGNTNIDGTFTVNGSPVSGGGISSVFDDTTPKLGGNLDGNSNDIFGVNNLNVSGIATFQNNVKLLDSDTLSFGTGEDFKIGHYFGTNAITMLSGNLSFTDSSSNERLKLTNNGDWEIKDNQATTRLKVVSTGATVTGDLYATTLYGDGSNLTGISTYSDSSVDSHLNQSNPTSGYVLSWNGTDYAWVAQSGGGGGGSSLWTSTGYTGIGTSSAVGIGTKIEIIPYDDQDGGTLSFEGSAGNLFSVTNNLSSGSIFAVNDISGSPSIDVNADGTVLVAPYSTTEKVGVGTVTPGYKLDVVGDLNFTGTLYQNGSVFNPGVTPSGGEGAVQFNSSSNLSGISTLLSVSSSAFSVGIGTIIDIKPYDDQDGGTLSFEGSAGNLFSITNNLSSGSIFAVNDISGSPSIDVNADGTVLVAPYGTTEYLGVGTDNPQYKLDVNGTTKIGNMYVGIGNTDVIVEGDMRVTGILSIGQGTITLDPTNDEIHIGQTKLKRASSGEFEIRDRISNSLKSLKTAGSSIIGILSATDHITIRSEDGTPSRIDFYCESNNAHYTRIQAAAHSAYSGNATVTLPASSGTLLLTDGSGANLTSLNASNLGSGTIPDARFPSTLPAVSGASLTGLTGASAATYGSATATPVIVVDSDGRITGISTVATSGSGGGGGASEAFKTIAVSGQSDVVADTATDTLTLVAGNNMTITTNASGDSITFASSGSGGSSTLSGLTDVTISSPSSGQVLKYNGSAWVNDTDATGSGGGGSGTVDLLEVMLFSS